MKLLGKDVDKDCYDYCLDTHCAVHTSGQPTSFEPHKISISIYMACTFK